MRIGVGMLTVAVVGALFGLPSPAGASPDDPGRLIVVFKPSGVTRSERAEVHDGANADPVRHFGALHADVVKVDDVSGAMREYERQPDVAYVEPDAPVQAAANDPLYEHQWHLQPKSSSNLGTADVEPAWAKANGSGVTVAVVDTGVRRGGSDLDSSRVLAGRDFVNGDNDPTDDNGHGTHIAGTIAESTNNGKGAAGVAPGAKILPVKVLDSTGAGTYSNVIDGVLWAKDRAQVINLSLAGTTYSQALCDAMQQAAAKAVIVAAAGNLGAGSVAYPAACDGVLAVGAVRYDGQRPSYSNTGSALDLVAPGGDLDVDQDADGYGDGILQQTFEGSWSYTFYEGTSMAAAHVSGVAALVLDANAKADVPKVLKETARDLGPVGWDSSFGSGAIDARAAVDRVAATAQGPGYWLAGPDGRVFAFGGATDFGSPARARAASAGAGARTIDISSTPAGSGYWVLDAAGGIFSFGTARFHGSIPGLRAKGAHVGRADVVDLAATPTGQGYWVLDRAGGIFSFGDARYFGSVPGLRAKGAHIGAAQVIGMAATPTGQGYWILDSAGGMFSFGDAKYFGSLPALRAKGKVKGPSHVIGMSPSSTGKGYWLLDSSGGMFSFGDARYFGSVPGLRAAGKVAGAPRVVAMSPTPDGKGYWVVDSRGGVFAFGGARYLGSLPERGVTEGAVGIAVKG